MLFLCSMIDSEEERTKCEQIYLAYKNTMYRVAFAITKNHHDSQDVVAESMMKVIRVLKKVTPESIGTKKCKNLMIVITENAAFDYLRKAKREAACLERMETEETCTDAEAFCLEMENYQELTECINSLDLKYREILYLKVQHGLDPGEIAGILNISRANVNMRFMRAKGLLAERLKEKNGYA